MSPANTPPLLIAMAICISVTMATFSSRPNIILIVADDLVCSCSVFLFQYVGVGMGGCWPNVCIKGRLQYFYQYTGSYQNIYFRYERCVIVGLIKLIFDSFRFNIDLNCKS